MESRYAPKLVRHDPSPDAHVTANWVTFKDNVEALALEGLYGCTSIVLVSQRSAWMSHIWETTFVDHNSDDFEYMVTDDLLYRPPPGDPLFEYYEYGLENLKNSKEHGDPGIMFGDEDVESAKLEMQAFIITPRQHLHPAFYYDANNEVVNEDILKDIDHQKGTVKYPEKVNRLVGVITETYGAIPVQVVDYNPVFLPREKWETWVIEGSLLDDNGISKSAEEILTDLTIGTPRGKVLIQYQPAKTCVEMAKWRLWVEGQQASHWADQWTPTYDQIFSFPGESSGLARRQGRSYNASYTNHTNCPVELVPKVNPVDIHSDGVIYYQNNDSGLNFDKLFAVAWCEVYPIVTRTFWSYDDIHIEPTGTVYHKQIYIIFKDSYNIDGNFQQTTASSA
ncbi:hypothetical protein EsH8_V_000191 [Colletotrichum jinshuiense]